MEVTYVVRPSLECFGKSVVPVENMLFLADSHA